MINIKLIKSKYFILLLAFGLVLNSCKKKGHISGRVINLADGSPVEGAFVSLVYGEPGMYGVGGEAFSQALDNNGEFSFDSKYIKRNKVHYTIKCSSAQNQNFSDTSSEIVRIYSYGDNYKGARCNYFNIDKVKSNYFEFKVPPFARLKLIAVDIPPINNIEKLSIGIYDENIINEDGSYYYSIMEFDTTYAKIPKVFDYHNVRTMGKIKVQWQITQNQQTNIKTEEIALAPFRKATYYIYY